MKISAQPQLDRNVFFTTMKTWRSEEGWMGSQEPLTAGPGKTLDLVGRRVRDMRRAKGLSLDRLAEGTGLSTGFLSQVERGLSSPSLRDLAIIAERLDIGITDLFDSGDPPAEGPKGDDVVVRRARRSRLQRWRAGISKQLLTPRAGDSALSVYLVHLEPGASTGQETYSHQGDEAGFVMAGALLLTVEDRTWHLERGDSFRFASQRPHRFSNPEASLTTVIWVNVL
jgi:transcriptional regulator with XRE-family HTH domain